MLFKSNFFNNFLFCLFLLAKSKSYLVFWIIFESQISLKMFKNKLTSFTFSFGSFTSCSNFFLYFIKTNSKFSLTISIGSFKSNLSSKISSRVFSFFSSGSICKFSSLFFSSNFLSSSSFIFMSKSFSDIPINF